MKVLTPKVRLWLYRIGAAVVPVLVLYGVLSGDEAAAWLAVLAAILAPAGLALAAANVPRSR